MEGTPSAGHACLEIGVSPCGGAGPQKIDGLLGLKAVPRHHDRTRPIQSLIPGCLPAGPVSRRLQAQECAFACCRERDKMECEQWNGRHPAAVGRRAREGPARRKGARESAKAASVKNVGCLAATSCRETHAGVPKSTNDAQTCTGSSDDPAKTRTMWGATGSDSAKPNGRGAASQPAM